MRNRLSFFYTQKAGEKMPDVIDELKVQVDASTQNADDKIDRFIQKMKDLQKVITGIDMKHMDGFASQIDKMSLALSRMSGLGIKQSMGGIESQVNRSCKQIASDLAGAFDIRDKSSLRRLGALSKELAALLKTGNDGAALDANMAGFVSEIEAGIANTRVWDDEMRRFYDTVKSVDKIRISPQDKSGLGDDWKYMDGLLRQKMSTTDGISLDTLMSGWRNQFPGVFGDEIDKAFNLDAVQGQFQALNQIIKQCREGVVINNPNSITNEAILDEVVKKVGGLYSQIEKLKNAAANTAGTPDAGFDIAGLEKIVKSVTKMGSADTEKGINNLASMSTSLVSLVNNLNSTGGITFDTDSITGLAYTIGKLGSDAVTKATQNLGSLKVNLADFLSAMNISGSKGFDTTKLSSLIGAVTRLGSEKAKSAAVNLPMISSALNRFVASLSSAGGVSFNFSGLSNLINSIGKLGGVKATQSVKNLKPIKDQLLKFVSGLNGIGALNFDTTNLTNLVSSITKLGGKGATNAIPNIQQLGTALKQMMATLSKAPQVSQNLIDMTNALANLASNGNRVNTIANSMQGGLGRYSRGAKSATRHSFNLASAIGKVYATYWMLFRALRWFGKSITLASDLVEVQNVIDVSFGNMSRMVDDFTSNSIQKFGMSELAAKKMSGVFMAMGRSLGGSQKEMAKMSIELTKLAADMASFYNVSQEDVGEALQSIYSGMIRPLRNFGIDLTQANLQQFAFAQGIEKPIRAMSQLEKATLRYQYVMQATKGIQGDFQRTSLSWANQLRLLGQQFQQLGGVVGGTLINAFKPFIVAMNQVIAKLIEVARAISAALGKIFGWTFESAGAGAGMSGITSDIEDASDAMDDFGGSTGAAADNAKKLAGNLQAFDHLNVISSQNDSSGGGGAGGGAGTAGAGAGDIGEWKKGESLFEKYKSDIDSLYELGEYIGNALIGAMQGIDWDRVYSKAGNFGTGLASFLNGLISPELFYETGGWIASCLNTALHALDSFGIEFDWKDFGNSIAAGINGFFDKFDFALLAHTLNVWALGILDAALEAVSNVKWGGIGEKIGTFLKEVDYKSILKKVGELIWKGINAGFEFYESMFNAAPLETALLTLYGLTKALKTNYLANFTKAVNKAWIIAENFGGVLAGNKTAIQNMSAVLPNATSLIAAFGEAYRLLVFGMTNGHPIGGVAAALTTIRSNLSGMAKLAIGAAGGFAEFSMVKNSLEDIVTDSGNIIANLAKLAGGAAIGSAALYTAFGPAGLAMSAIVGIAGAIIGIKNATEEIAQDSSIGQFSDAIGDLGKQVSEKTQSIRENIASIKTDVDEAGQAEVQMARDLATEYDTLHSKSDLTASDKVRLKQVSEDLINVIPGLSKYIDEETGCLNTQKETIDAVIDGYENLAKKQAAQEYMVEAYKNQYEAQMNLSKAQKEYNEAAEEFLKNHDGMSETVQELVKTGDIEQLKRLKEQVWDLNGSSEQLQFWFGKNVSDGRIANMLLSELEQSTSAYDSAVQGANTALDEAANQIAYLRDVEAEAERNQQKAIETEKAAIIASSEYKQALSNLNTEFDKMGVTLSDGFMQNLALDENFSIEPLQEFFSSLAENVPASAEALQSAFSTIGQSLPDELAKSLAGKEAETQASAVSLLMSIKSGVEPTVPELSEMFKTLGYTLPDSYAESLAEKDEKVQTETLNNLAMIESGFKLVDDNLISLFSGLGENLPAELIQSLEDNEAPTQKKAIELIGQIKEAEESEREPLIQALTDLGIDGAEGLGSGMESKESDIAEISKHMVDTVKSAPQAEFSSANSGDMYEYGANASKGFWQGVKDWWDDSWLGRKIEEMKGTVTRKDKLDENSPSKVMTKYGAFAGIGFNNGFEEEMDKTVPMIDAWIDGVKSSVSGYQIALPGVEMSYSIPDPMASYDMPKFDLPSMSSSLKMDYTSEVTASLKGSNAELLRELKRNNDLLEQLIDKPIIDDGMVYNATRREVARNVSRTGKTGFKGID